MIRRCQFCGTIRDRVEGCDCDENQRRERIAAENHAPNLTPVQREVLVRLGNSAQGTASVGRGCSFKCNRITARSLEALGLVRIDGSTYALTENYVLALTNAGRALATTLTKGTP